MVEHVAQFDDTRGTLPGFDMYLTVSEKESPFGADTQVLHVVVSSCREVLG